MALGLPGAIGTMAIEVVPDTSNFGAGLTKGVLGVVAGLGAVLAGAAVAGITAFAGFEKQMNEVFTLLPGISQGAMDDMTGQVKGFAKEFGTLPNEVVPALYQAISAGVPRENVFEFLETAQKAAIGGVTDLETAVDGISSVVNAYGSDVLSAAQASDVMFTGVRLGKTTMDELSRSLFQVIPTASSLGVGFGDVTAALAAMTAQGTPTSVATTQLRQLFVDLSKEGTATSKAFQEIAGVGFQEFIAGGGNVQQALQLLEQHAADSGISIADLFGSVEAGQAALALTGQGTEAFTRNLGEMANSAGATDAAYDQMNRGIGRSFDRIKAAVAVAFIDIGDRLGPLVAQFADAFEAKLPAMIDFVVGVFEGLAGFVTNTLIPAFQTISDWWTVNGPAITAAVGLVVGGLATAFTTVFDAIRTGVAFVTEHWEGFKVAIIAAAALMTPVLLTLGVTSSISAAKQAAAWLLSSTSALRAAAVTTVQVGIMVAKWVFVGAQSLLHAAKVVIAWGLTGAAALAQVAVHVAQTGIMVAKWAWAGVQSLLHAGKVALAWLIAMGPIALVIAAVVGLVALIVANWDTIKRVTGELVAAIKEKFGEAVAWLAGLPGRIQSAIGDLGSLLYSAGQDLLQGLIRGAVAMMGRVATAIVNAISGAISAAKRRLGFGSPPQFMIDTGAEMAEGVAEGLLGTRDRIAKAAAAALAGAGQAGPSLRAGGLAGAGGYSHANIYVEVDRHTLVRLIGQPLVDELRVRTGKRQ